MSVTVPKLRSGSYTLEEPRLMQIPGHPFPHEYRVALPNSYRDSTRHYPVLWVTDNGLEAALAVVGAREVILVAVGGRPEDPVAFPANGRAYDFYPRPSIYAPGPIGESLRSKGILDPGGGAAAFRDFLIDAARPELSAEYRMDPSDHALFGYSAGGWFTVYSMFSRPGGFAKYIAGAPALNFSEGLLWEIEKDYAAAHEDLAAQIYFFCGDVEMVRDYRAECFSAMARMIEILSFREYPSLKLKYRVLVGETHESGYPIGLSSAVRELWPTPA